MELELIGDDGSSEYRAAREFAERMSTFLRPQDRLTIVAGAQCFGEKNVDVDLLVIAEVAPDLLVPDSWLPSDLRGLTVGLSSFVATIEIKDHPASRIRIEGGNRVCVEYRGKWSSATEQAMGQQVSVRNFLRRHGMQSAPWVSNFIWLRNWPDERLPSIDHNIFGSDLSASEVVKRLAVAQLENLRNQQKSGWRKLSLGSSAERVAEVAAVGRMFRREIECSELDRKKVEQICRKRVLQDQGYVDRLGEQLLVFRGRGGTGKTFRLLQIATDLYDHHGARVLILTYNIALVSDIRRLFAIHGTESRIGAEAIKIDSSTRYFFDLLRSAGYPVPSRDGFPEAEYIERKAELLEMLRSFSREEVLDMASSSDPWAEAFSWDFVLVDEGQDWPSDERDLLYHVFGAEKIIVADGVDQLVRSGRRCEWATHPRVGRKQIVTLRKSLRLKSNLCRFAEALSEKLEIDWDLAGNDDVPGGRVILLRSEYDRHVHDRLMAKHESVGNQPVDALFCTTGLPGCRSNLLPERMQEWGLSIWDGTIRERREEFARDVKQHRIVRYESSRGLEGWTVVCLDFDNFLEAKRREAMSDVGESLMEAPEEAARRTAGRWAMIPVTRAMDTLLIQVDPESRVGKLLLEVSGQCPDFVEVW